MVIGVNAADALFPGQNQIVGTKVRMGGYNFEIIGVLENEKPVSSERMRKIMPSSFPSARPRRLHPQRDTCLVIRGRSGQVTEALTQAEDTWWRRRNVKSATRTTLTSRSDKFIEQFDSITAMVG